MTHTPGPWKADTGLGCKAIKGNKAGDHKQAQYTEIAWTVGLRNEATDRDNARLLAAAPALRAFVAEIADTPGELEVRCKARALLAATPEPSQED